MHPATPPAENHLIGKLSRVDAHAPANRDLVAAVVARWRGVAMSNKPVGNPR